MRHILIVMYSASPPSRRFSLVVAMSGAALSLLPVGSASGSVLKAGTSASLVFGTWKRIPSGPLSARSGQAALWTGSRFLIWGGQEVTQPEPSSDMFNDGALFDPRTDRWTIMPRSPLSPRDQVAAVWTGHEALLWGGQTEDTASTPADSNSGAAYDPATRRWSRLPASPLSPRSDATALWTGTEAIFIGGDSPPGSAPSRGNGLDVDGALYDPTTRRWSRLPPLPRKGLGSPNGMTAVWAGTKLIFWGVFESTTYLGSNTTETRLRTLSAEWTPGQRSWRRLSNSANVAIGGATATWLSGRVVLVGGSNGGAGPGPPPRLTGSVALYDPATNRWTTSPQSVVLTSPELVASIGTDLAIVNETAEITGPGVNLQPGDGVLFNPKLDRITALPPAPSTLMGTSASMVWTGHGLVMWGVIGDTTKTFGLELPQPRPA